MKSEAVAAGTHAMTLSREQTMALLEVYKQHMGKPFVLSGMDLAASHLVALDEVERLKAALRLIADGQGKCKTCGTWAVGEGGGYTACCCEYPYWTLPEPSELARAALEDRT